MKFDLQYDEVLHGTFNIGALNLMMVLQVNCPGCLLHGIPRVNQLHAKYKDSVNFSLLSTAFEDFELNTSQNTKLLLTEGQLIGETKKALGGINLNNILLRQYPVLYDRVSTGDELNQPFFVNGVANNHLELRNTDKLLKDNFVKSLQGYYSKLPQCGYTFAANLLHGTPTFVLFDIHMNVKESWFGHVNDSIIAEKIDEELKSAIAK